MWCSIVALHVVGVSLRIASASSPAMSRVRRGFVAGALWVRFCCVAGAPAVPGGAARCFAVALAVLRCSVSCMCRWASRVCIVAVSQVLCFVVVVAA